MPLYSDQDLDTTDLIVDAVYKGTRTAKGGLADPLVRLLGVSRQGGFRYRGRKEFPTMLVLTSNLAETEWPDELDPTLGRFTYYGDNRHAGRQLHETPRFGNRILRDLFDRAHSERRGEIPPVLIFTSEGSERSFRFRGLAVPGYPGLSPTEDLVAIWKTQGQERFQNYRAVFTILDAPVVSRAWVRSMAGEAWAVNSLPEAWLNWVMNGTAKPLIAPRAQLIRTKTEQLPRNKGDLALIQAIHGHYQNDPHGFEQCAGEIAKLLLGSVSRLDLTRPWRDGGRDGIGKLRVGQGGASIEVTFALEAKCYSIRNSVGVREVSRLISRIRHREFGILVTTSFIDNQAYTEVVDDDHPVIFVTAADIVVLLRTAGHDTSALVSKWLKGLSSCQSAEPGRVVTREPELVFNSALHESK